MPARLCSFGLASVEPVNWQAEKLQNSQKNCRFLRTATVLCTPHSLANDAANVWKVENG